MFFKRRKEKKGNEVSEMDKRIIKEQIINEITFLREMKEEAERIGNIKDAEIYEKRIKELYDRVDVLEGIG